MSNITNNLTVTLNITARDVLNNILKKGSEELKLALEMADELAREDVQTYGQVPSSIYNSNQGWFVAWSDDKQLQRAVRYIELRGDELPYTVERKGSLIRFGKKPVPDKTICY